MNRRGAILMDTLFGALIALMLVGITAILLTVFWQSWHQVTLAGQERHYVSTSFFWIGRDLERATAVSVSSTILTIDIPGARVSYRQSVDDSFYRRVGQTNTPLASRVSSARFREEGGLIWVTLTFTSGESWESCYSHPLRAGP